MADRAFGIPSLFHYLTLIYSLLFSLFVIFCSDCSLQREVILSPECWARVKDYFVADINESGHAFLKDCKVPVKKISVFVTEAKRKQQGGLSQAQTDLLARYVPAAILPFVEHHEERWAGELRRITVLFVNLGIGESQLASMNTEKDLNFIHKVLVSVQNALYKYEGSLNKFLMDDKGSTLISVYGLPPLAHEDDAVRGVLAALEVVNELQTLGLKGSVGVTFGMACAGLVGNKGGGRREYSILGKTNELPYLIQLPRHLLTAFSCIHFAFFSSLQVIPSIYLLV